MVKSILENAGYKVGLIGTIEAIIGDKTIPASQHNTGILYGSEIFSSYGRSRM